MVIEARAAFMKPSRANTLIQVTVRASDGDDFPDVVEWVYAEVRHPRPGIASSKWVPGPCMVIAPRPLEPSFGRLTSAVDLRNGATLPNGGATRGSPFRQVQPHVRQNTRPASPGANRLDFVSDDLPFIGTRICLPKRFEIGSSNSVAD